MAKGLDEILQDGKGPSQDQQQTTDTTTKTETTPTTAVVEKQGKQADKDRPATTAQTAAKAATETVVADTAAQAAGDGADAANAEPRKGGTVPIDALHASRQETKEARERVLRLESVLERFLTQAPGAAAPGAKVEPPKRREIWDGPDEWGQALVEPVQQQLAGTIEKVSKIIAVQTHGKETVQAAYQAMGEAMQNGDQRAVLEYRRIMSSDHPYDELVTWHKRTAALAEIGEDPTAYRERLKAELLAELNGGAASGDDQQQGRTTSAPTVMPSDLAGARNVGSRSGPAWAGPRSIDDIIDAKRSRRA